MSTLLIVLVACASDSQSAQPGPVPSEPPPVPVVEVPATAPLPEKPPAAPKDLANPPPEGWVDLAKHIPGIKIDIRYHTAQNFTEAPLPGYGAPAAWLLVAPADALKQVQEELVGQGKSLLVYDAYRPLRGTKAMVAWAKRTQQVDLLDNGYIARRSGHNRGNTIDLSVIDLGSGEELDMGTPWDTLDVRSHTWNAKGKALENRLLLRTIMHKHGWRNYHKEWWHYSFAMEEKLVHRDVPYGCFEPAESAWAPPVGWAEPGFQMPLTWEPTPCP